MIKINNKKKFRQFKRTMRTRKKHYAKVYSYKIRTAIVNYVTPDYTERNLSFPIYDLLRNTTVWSKIQGQYLQYQLNRVTFISIPRTVGGTDPSPIWLYLDTNGTVAFNYTIIQELQGARSLPVKYTKLNKFSRTGRQNDFHYWYDVNGMDETQSFLTLRLHSETTPDEHRHWQFQIEFSVKFRGFIGTDQNVKENKEQVVKVLKEEETDKKIEAVSKADEEEDSEEIWHAEDIE